MGYSPSKCTDGLSLNLAENHEKITIEVRTIEGNIVDTVVRTVMSNDGKRYITYNKSQYQVKKMKKIGDDLYSLKVSFKVKT